MTIAPPGQHTYNGCLIRALCVCGGGGVCGRGGGMCGREEGCVEGRRDVWKGGGICGRGELNRCMCKWLANSM